MAFGNGTDIHDILPPYDLTHRPPTVGVPEIGQVVYTVVPDFGRKWQIYDAVRSDHQTHSSVSGTIRGVDEDKDYKPKAGRLPVFRIGLGDCVELLAMKSKMRPCVVLATADGIPDKALPASQRNRAREAFLYPAALVAPAYSVDTAAQPRSVTTTIAARAECLVYPQLAFLPRSGGVIKNDSVLRLDRAFWTTLPKPSELCPMGVSKNLPILRDGLHNADRRLMPRRVA